MRKILVLPAVLFYLACQAGAAVLPAEKLLPDDTLAVYTMPDLKRVREIYQISPPGRLWSDPAMKDFKDKFMNKLMSEYITPLEHQLGVHFEDYTNLAQGQFTIAMVQNGWEGKDGQMPGLVLLVDSKDKSAQLKTNLLDLRKKWVDAGKTVKTEKVRDIDFSVIVVSKDDLAKAAPKKPANLAPGIEPMEDPDAKNAPKTQIYIGQAESLLIVANSPKVIEKILARMTGGEVKSLSELAAFDANSAMFRGSPGFGWVNAKALVDIIGRAAEDSSDADSPNPLGIKPDKVVSALGLKGLKTIAFGYNYSSEGTVFNVTFSVPEANRTGLFKILAGEAKDYNAPPFVPADAVKFQRWRLDGQKTWATLRKIVSDVSPAGVGGLDMLLNSADAAAKEKDPNFDINKNLFGNLGDDMISYSKSPRGTTLAELSSPPSIFLLGSPNAEQLAGALKSIFMLYSPGGAATKEREFLGHKINSIPLPATPGSADATPRSLSYVSSGGYLAISMDNALLEEYLRSSESHAKSLRDTPGLSEAMQKVAGSGTSLFGYSNESESMRVLFEALKKDSAGADPLAPLTPMAMAMGMGDVKIKDWIDLSLLPTFDKVSKYFYFSVYAGSANADGLTFKAFAPVPPQLNK